MLLFEASRARGHLRWSREAAIRWDLSSSGFAGSRPSNTLLTRQAGPSTVAAMVRHAPSLERSPRSLWVFAPLPLVSLVALAACAGAGSPSAGPEASVTVPQPSAEPSASASAVGTASAAPGDASAPVVLPRIGASIQPLAAGKVEDTAKEAAIRGAGFVIKLHRLEELEKVVAPADARRQIALRDAAEFGLRGLVRTADPPDDEQHTPVEDLVIAPREFLLADRSLDHVHVYVWRRSAEGGWVWADCRADSLAEMPRIRRACLTLAVTR